MQSNACAQTCCKDAVGFWYPLYALRSTFLSCLHIRNVAAVFFNSRFILNLLDSKHLFWISDYHHMCIYREVVYDVYTTARNRETLVTCRDLEMEPWRVETAIKESSTACTRTFDLTMLIQKILAGVSPVFQEAKITRHCFLALAPTLAPSSKSRQYDNFV